MMPKPFVIETLHCKRQGKKIFSDISFQLDAGELLLVEGANGSGKSSLLRLLAGLASPASGAILWYGHLIHPSTTEFHRHLHYIGHTNGLRLDLTVAENLSLSDITILSAMQIQHYLHTPVRLLSAGQKRKIALARLLVSPRKLWLLDEPLAALDNDTQLFFLEKLRQHLQQGGIAVITSHQPIHLPEVSIQRLKL